MSLPRKPARVLRAAEIAAAGATFSHPWNPNSEMHGSMLSRVCGLERVGINLIRVPPGKESFVYHSHLHEEEWLYILSGRATLEIGDATHEIAAGDFIAFPAPSEAHLLRNTSSEDIVYLSGSDRAPLDIADYPRLGRRMIRVGEHATVYELASGGPFPFPGVEQF